MPSKFVVTGAVNGRIRDVFGKIEALHAKNSFTQAIITGNLFADVTSATDENNADIEALIRGAIKVPLPTFFVLGSRSLPSNVIAAIEKSGGDVCDNLHFLGRRNITKTIDGLRIVALGGVLDPNPESDAAEDAYAPVHSANDAKALRGANSTDILITTDWPDAVEAGSRVKIVYSEDGRPRGQASISELCSALKPRYFFSAAADVYYEREPFSYPPSGEDGQGHYITRFISLASYGNKEKQKWIYAFSLDPSAARPNQLPQGVTTTPFTLGTRKRPAPENGSFQRFSTDTGHERRYNKRQKQPLDAGQCFFCISNANVAQHLISSIADEAYLTTAKGPLSARDTFPDLDFPCHMLIIPMSHAPTLSRVPDPDSRQNTVAEMQRYQTALNEMLVKQAEGRLGSVTWEVSRSANMHTHWQYLPMPASMIAKGLVEAAFRVQAENDKYPTFETADEALAARETSDCFRLWLWSRTEDGNILKKHLSMPLDSSFRFDMQFGRKVLAKLLNLEHRSNWRDCDQSEADETEDVALFKQAFEPYDFAE